MERGEMEIDIAHKLYRCRKAAKNIYGGRYREYITPYQEEIRRWMPKHDNRILETVIAMAGLLTNHVMGTILLMAAAVEMIENEKAPAESKEGER